MDAPLPLAHTNSAVAHPLSLPSQSTGLYQYFVKVVPTIYTDASGATTLTSTYSHTERFRALLVDYDEELSDGDNAGHFVGGNQHSLMHGHHMVNTGVLPGVFWVYELNPFAVTVDKSCVVPGGTFLHFIVRVMAVTGGLFTVSSLTSEWVEELVGKGAKMMNAEGGGISLRGY